MTSPLLLGASSTSAGDPGAFVSLAPAAAQSGDVVLGDGSTVTIGRSAFVGAGMLVVEGTISNVGNADGVVVTTKTVASTSGLWDIYGISSQNTNQQVDTGISDTGRRVGITGDAYNASTLFAGTLATQWGVRGRAGFAAAAGSGARTVTSAAGGYFEIRNEAAGTTITNAYGVFINNSDASGGTITNRYDLYASSALAKSYFAGKVGIGTTDPQTWLHIGAGTDSAADLEAVRLTNLGENGTKVLFYNASGPLAGITGTKLGAGASADEGVVSISTAVNAVLAERVQISTNGTGIGVTPTASNGYLQLPASTTLATGGIAWGTDTSLYRSSANTVATGGDLRFNTANKGIVDRSDYRVLAFDNGYAILAGLGISAPDGANIVLGTTTGTKIGTGTTQKLGFYNATPVVRPSGVAVDAAGIHAALVTLGLIAA